MADEQDDSTIYDVVVNHEEQVLDLAGIAAAPGRLAEGGLHGPESGVPGTCQPGLDRYATAQPAAADGRARPGRDDTG